MELKIGAVGPEVSALKKKLVKLGYELNDTGINKGAFGPKVHACVEDFQEKNNLTVDGWAGRLTLIAIDRKIAEIKGKLPQLPVAVEGIKPQYWKPGPYHPMFIVPAGYTHLHPLDILRSVRGEREILGSKDNPLIAHFHEHSGNLGKHSEGADYHDEVPHCSSAWQWACDGGGCYKTDNALASSWDKYHEMCGAIQLKIGDWVEEGDLVRIAHPGGHITAANRRFRWTGKGSFEGFGSNQNNTIKTSTYEQAHIKSVHRIKAKPGTVLAPINTPPVPSTGVGNGESTR